MNATEIRVRTKVHPDTIQSMVGKVLSEADYDVLLKGPTNVFGPSGKLIAKYLPGALSGELLEASYPTLHELRKLETTNRGYASGTQRVKGFKDSTRTYSESVPSAIVGAMDPSGQQRYCRLTAWTGREAEKFGDLVPLFQTIGGLFRYHVPDLFEVQMGFVKRTHRDWVIAGTPFTTITVNNSYPTGVHTDKGDLEEGFSNLACLRRGDYRGGIFVFAEYRIGVDMQHGDVLLMDAHEWHGNTAMYCGVCGERMGPGGTGGHDERCGAERISIVSYYRTKIAECGSAEEEAQRAVEVAEKRANIAASTNTLVERQAEENAAAEVPAG